MSRLEYIRKRESEATPGPWNLDVESEKDGDETIGYEIVIRELRRVFHSSDWADPDEWDTDLSNAEFIAHAREDIPFLLAEVERLREGLRIARNCCCAPEDRAKLTKLLEGK